MTKLVFGHIFDTKNLENINTIDDRGFAQGRWVSFFWLLDQHSWTHPSNFQYYINDFQEGEGVKCEY